MQIHVILLNGKDVITLEANLDNTVADIKAKICRKIGIFPKNQTLVFDGRILDDEQCLLHYNVANDNALFLKSFTMNIEIFLNISKDKIIILKVNPDDTIGNIKAMILEKESTLTGQIELIYREKQLENERTLSDYNIQEESMIYVEHFIKIFVKTKSDVLALKVKLNDTVNYVKSMIQNKTKIPAEKQCLFYNKKQLFDYGDVPPEKLDLFQDNKQLFDNAKILSEYGIKNASILHLKEEYVVIVQSYKETMKKPFVVKPDQNVSTLLNEVSSWLDIDHINRNPDHDFYYATLQYEGKQLNRYHKLVDYHIHEDSIIISSLVQEEEEYDCDF